MNTGDLMDLLDAEGLREALETVTRLRLANIEPKALVFPEGEEGPRLLAERVFDLPIVRGKVEKPGVLV